VGRRAPPDQRVERALGIDRLSRDTVLVEEIEGLRDFEGIDASRTVQAPPASLMPKTRIVWSREEGRVMTSPRAIPADSNRATANRRSK
jgi:hypothetical protein